MVKEDRDLGVVKVRLPIKGQMKHMYLHIIAVSSCMAVSRTLLISFKEV